MAVGMKPNRDAPSLLNNIPVLFTDTLVSVFIKIELGHISREGRPTPHYMHITFTEHNEKYNTGHICSPHVPSGEVILT